VHTKRRLPAVPFEPRVRIHARYSQCAPASSWFAMILDGSNFKSTVFCFSVSLVLGLVFRLLLRPLSDSSPGMLNLQVIVVDSPGKRSRFGRLDKARILLGSPIRIERSKRIARRLHRTCEPSTLRPELPTRLIVCRSVSDTTSAFVTSFSILPENQPGVAQGWPGTGRDLPPRGQGAVAYPPMWCHSC